MFLLQFHLSSYWYAEHCPLSYTSASLFFLVLFWFRGFLFPLPIPSILNKKIKKYTCLASFPALLSIFYLSLTDYPWTCVLALFCCSILTYFYPQGYPYYLNCLLFSSEWDTFLFFIPPTLFVPSALTCAFSLEWLNSSLEFIQSSILFNFIHGPIGRWSLCLLTCKWSVIHAGEICAFLDYCCL